MKSTLLVHTYKRLLGLAMLILLIIILNPEQGKAQTPGLIIKPALAPGNSVLDPNGDGYVSQLTNGVQLGFTIPPNNDVTQSEIPYVAIIRPDPLSDILRGPVGGFSEIVGVDAAGNNAILVYRDATNLLVRFRLGGFAPNSKSYSLMIDTDGKFGFTGPNADPNAVTGNPGFEAEIVLETNFNVKAYNVDGTTSGTEVTSYSYDTNCQKSVAVSTASGDPDYFYDFYLPLSSLSSLFTSATPLRIVAVTVMNPHPAIGNNALSDIGGVTTGSNIDDQFIDLIDGQTPTIPGVEVLDRSVCPTVNPVSSSSTTITGSSTEASGTTINVYVYQSNGITLIGSGITTVSGGAWTVNVASLSPSVVLANGQIVEATATASGKGVSYNNCSITTVSSCSSPSDPPTATEVTKVSGSKGFNINLITRPIGTIVYLYTSNYTLRSVSDLKNGVTNPATTTASPQTISFECQTGNCFGADVYYVRIEEPGKCISPYYVACDYASGTSTTPTITTSTITTSTTSISGTGTTASSQIFIYADGTQIGSATSAALSPFGWTATVSGLSLCKVITASQITGGACLSAATAGITVTRKASSPAITTSGCSVTPPTTIGGTSDEIGAIVTLYKNPSTSLGIATVQNDGSWSVTSLSLSVSDVLYAKITSGTCLTASDNSATLTITTQTSNVSTITTDPVLEGTTSLSGTGTTGDIITLYVDGSAPMKGDGSLYITTVSGGTWTISGISAYEFYIGGTVTVTATTSGFCEGAQSGSKIVQCVEPTIPSYTGGNFPYCVGNAGQMSLITSQSGVVYQLVNGSGVAVGPASIGTGSGITMSTNALLVDLLNVYVKAYKIGYSSCSATASTVINFTPDNLTPSITLTSTALEVAKGTTTVNLPYSAKSTSPVADNYTITYDATAIAQAFANVAPVTLSASSGNIALAVPAAPANGNYTGTLKINQPGGTGCSHSYGFTITVFDAPVIKTQPASIAICSGTQTTLSVDAVGVGTLTYQWQIATNISGPYTNVSDGTGGASSSYTTANLTATKYYRVVVTNGITPDATSNPVTVTINPAPVATGSISGNASVCAGQTLTYSISAIFNATSYTWTYGGSNVTITGTTNSVSLAFASNATSGTLSVHGVNACGSGNDLTLAITVNPAPAINNLTKNACNGVAFTVTPVDVTDGTVPAGTTYSWAAPSVTGGITGGASGTAASNITGTLTNPTASTQTATYTVTPTKGTCVGNTFTITVSLNSPILLTATPVAVLCNGASTGSVNLTVTGGTPGYTYAWTGPSSFTSTSQNLSGLAAGTYNVTVTDNKGCTATTSAIVTEPVVMVITPSVTNVTCNGGSTGAISIGVTGGTGTKTYAWNDGNTSQNRTGLIAGTYSVTVTDANGCTKASGSIVLNPPTIISASAGASAISCNGGTSTITVTASGGTGTLTYSLNGVDYQAGNTFTGIAASASPYVITVKDANLCTVTTNVTVSQPAALSLSTSVTNPTCPVGNPTNDSNGSINLTVNGGTAAFNYSWTASGTGVVPSGHANDQNLTTLKAGIYSVTVTDANGCTATTSVTLTAINPAPVTPGTITK